MAYFEQHKTGRVAAWPGKAVDDAGTHGINDCVEHDGHRARCFKQQHCRLTARDHDDIGPKCNQFRHVSTRHRNIGAACAYLDADVAAFGPTEAL